MSEVLKVKFPVRFLRAHVCASTDPGRLNIRGLNVFYGGSRVIVAATNGKVAIEAQEDDPIEPAEGEDTLWVGKADHLALIPQKICEAALELARERDDVELERLSSGACRLTIQSRHGAPVTFEFQSDIDVADWRERAYDKKSEGEYVELLLNPECLVLLSQALRDLSVGLWDFVRIRIPKDATQSGEPAVFRLAESAVGNRPIRGAIMPLVKD